MATSYDALIFGSRVTSSFGSKLREVSQNLVLRPASVVYILADRRYLVHGWRHALIDECLDACSTVVDDYHLDLATFVVDSAAYKLAWARNNRDKARDNSRKQWVKQNARMRSDYAECIVLFSSTFPLDRPPGFDTWRRSFLKLWHSDKTVCVERMRAWSLDASKGSFLAGFKHKR